MLEIFLQPGEYYFGDRHTRIRTLLGSCVSLVFWHPHRLIGGMCHYMLPRRGPGRAGALDGRYADEAIKLLLDEIHGAGARPGDFHIRMFGGGSMFSGGERSRSRHGVGGKNVEAARQIIKAQHLNLAEEHVEGHGYRNLIFDIGSGRVALKHVPFRRPLLQR